MSKKVYTVSQINTYIRDLLGQDFLLRSVQVSGEVSDCKYHSSGHIYFTLKDEKGTLSAVMFSRDKACLKFRLEKGQKVIVTGRIGSYEAQSKYQLYANKIEIDGAGDLFVKFEQLKKELAETGMFDPMYKQPLPAYALKIGIVTAPGGAAVRDILQIASRRNPYVQMFLFPALVQGENAAASIVEGVRLLDRKGLDVLIVGRGGGSAEDLWAFNERIVCEAVFEAKTPVISAVGHETDFTLCDFVADYRAPTPSAAAEVAVWKISDFDDSLFHCTSRLRTLMGAKILDVRHRLSERQLNLSRFDPLPLTDQFKIRLSESGERIKICMARRLRDTRSRLADSKGRLKSGMDLRLNDSLNQLAVRAARVEALSPVAIISGGFAYLENGEGKRIKSAAQTASGEILRARLKDGTVTSRVESVDMPDS